MANTYREHVKRVQPTGPYAVMGYSLGTTVAYELAKRLEASGDEVVFCGALDSPPHIISLLGHLDWTAAAVRVAYFLELIAQDDIPTYEKEVRDESQAPIEVVKRLLELARPEQLAKLNLTPEQLMAIVNVTDNFGTPCISFLPYFSLSFLLFSVFLTFLSFVQCGRKKLTTTTNHRQHGQEIRTRGKCQTHRRLLLHPAALRVLDPGAVGE
jgi:hypothetical protein